MSEAINNWKTAVCDTRDRHEDWSNIADEQEPEAVTAYITALECLCAAYERARSTAPQGKPLVWGKVGWAYWTAEGASGEYAVIQQEFGCTVNGPGVSDTGFDEAEAKSMADKANAKEVASWLDLER